MMLGDRLGLFGAVLACLLLYCAGYVVIWTLAPVVIAIWRHLT
jgi:hypothetical protein